MVGTENLFENLNDSRIKFLVAGRKKKEKRSARKREGQSLT